MNPLQDFIEKMASSANPMLKNLAQELQQMSPQVAQQPATPGQTVLPAVQPAPLPPQQDPQLPDVNQTIESDNIVGTDTATKGTDEIDGMLKNQMPELAEEENQNQARFSRQKVATVKDVLLARLRK